MSHLRLDALREKLLRAGVAPRHVRHYLGELRQHFDDLQRAEAGNGLSPEAAFQAARARLGSDKELAAAMLAQPELRSISARFPWAVFGIAPAILLGLLIVAAVFVEVGVAKIVGPGGRIPASDWHERLKAFVTGWDWAMMYLFPILVAALVFCLGVRQFVRLRWLVLGALAVAILGAMVTSATVISNVPHESAFSVGFGFSSGTTWPRLAATIIPVCVMSALYWLWQRRTSALTN